MGNKYIKIKDASELLGVSTLTLRNWDKSGKLSAMRHPINNYRVYKYEDIEGMIPEISTINKRAKKKEREVTDQKFPTSKKLKVIHLDD